MSRLFNLTLVFLLALAFSPAGFGAEGAESAEARLREALRNTTLQLRTAQSDLATAQANQAGLVEEKKTLSDQLAVLRKQSAAEKLTSDKTTAELSNKVSAQAKRIKELEQELVSTQKDLRLASDTGHTTATRLEQVEAEKIVLQRKIADREAKNLALFILGNEILSRYEDYALGKALLAKEPFVGATRTKLENLVQDYEDRLQDERARE